MMKCSGVNALSNCLDWSHRYLFNLFILFRSGQVFLVDEYVKLILIKLQLHCMCIVFLSSQL